MRITKVRIAGEGAQQRVEIGWCEAPPNNPEAKNKDWDYYSLDLGVPPLKSLSDALMFLAPDIAEICELPKETADYITPRSVSFTYHHGVMGATITGIKGLEDSNGGVTLNTPHKPSESYSEGGSEVNVLGGETVAKLERLIEAAKAYIAGERGERIVEQQNLPFDNTDPEDDSVKYVLPDLLTQACESCSPELLANDKIAPEIFKIEGVPHVCVGTTGTGPDAWEEARVWRIVKRTDFEGDTFSFQELPPGGNLRGHLVSSGRSKWVLTGEEITLKPEPTEPPTVADAPKDLEFNDNPFEIPEGERVH